MNTTNETKHTAELIGRSMYSGQGQIYRRDTGQTVAVTYDEEGEVSAARLALRWNMHERLVEALRACCSPTTNGSSDKHQSLSEALESGAALLAELEQEEGE